MKNLKETLKEIYSISELSPNYYNKTHFVKERHYINIILKNLVESNFQKKGLVVPII